MVDESGLSKFPEYQYHLKDHLGNVRLTFSASPEIESNTATMEIAHEEEENANFLRYAETTKINSMFFDHTNNGDTHYAVRLNGSSNERIGLAKSLAVMTGDTVRAEAYVKYLDPDQNNWTAALQNLMAAIAAGTAPIGTVIEAVPESGGDGFPFGGLLGAAKAGETGPQAYLNILVFDENLDTLDMAYAPVTAAAKENGSNSAHEKLALEIVVQQPGYVYIYLSNDNEQPLEVFFDDFRVEHSHSAIVQADDYYPFGMTFNSYKRENGVANKLLYQGKELQEDLGLGTFDFERRMYDPATVRTFQIDPHSDSYYNFSAYSWVANNPLSNTDPTGMDIVYGGGQYGGDLYTGADAQDMFRQLQTANGGGRDQKVYEGNPLGEVTVTANEMSDLEKMRYDTGKDPITRSYLNGTRSKGRKISFGEGLGYETEFWQDMQTLGEGFAYAFGGLVIAPYAGTLLGGYSAATVPATTYSVANYVTILAYMRANATLTGVAGSASLALSKQASIFFNSPQVRLLRIRYPWLRSPLNQLGSAVKNIKLLPSRGEPNIPLDPRSPGTALYNLYKSTPEN